MPRETQKEVNKDHVRDSSQENTTMTEGDEETMSQKSTDVGAEVTHTHCVESGENAEKVTDKETSTTSEKESEKGREVVSNTTSEAFQVIKEEKTEVTTAEKQSGETIEICQETDKKDVTEREKERSKSSTGVLTQERKVSQENTCPVEDVKQEQDDKRQRLSSKEDTSCEEPQKLPKESGDADVGKKSGKPGHKTAKKKGMHSKCYIEVCGRFFSQSFCENVCDCYSIF